MTVALQTAAGLRGDPRVSFAGFYQRYEGPVLSYLLRRVHDPELAADLAAEAFAAALQSWLEGPPPVEQEAPWIFMIARSKWIDSWRRGRVEESARQALGMRPVALEDAELERIAAIGEGPLVRLLMNLSDDQRRAVEARILDDRDYDEIAAELRCSSQVVRKRVSRGLKALREQAERGER